MAPAPADFEQIEGPGYTIYTTTTDHDNLCIRFLSMPPRQLYNALRRAGFHWSHRAGAFVGDYTDERYYELRLILAT